MKLIQYRVNTGFAGATHTGSFEVEDDATTTEIEEMVFEAVMNHIEWSYTVDGEPA